MFGKTESDHFEYLMEILQRASHNYFFANYYFYNIPAVTNFTVQLMCLWLSYGNSLKNEFLKSSHKVMDHSVK